MSRLEETKFDTVGYFTPRRLISRLLPISYYLKFFRFVRPLPPQFRFLLLNLFGSVFFKSLQAGIKEKVLKSKQSDRISAVCGAYLQLTFLSSDLAKRKGRPALPLSVHFWTNCSCMKSAEHITKTACPRKVRDSKTYENEYNTLHKQVNWLSCARDFVLICQHWFKNIHGLIRDILLNYMSMNKTGSGQREAEV